MIRGFLKHLPILLAVAGLKTAVASDLDFTLVNKTPRSFEAIYLSSAENRDWDGNLLPEGKRMAAGERIAVKFSEKENHPLWDLNVVDADGVAVRFDKVKLEGADTVTLKEVDGKITAEVE